jgi:intracellular septation protein
MENKKISKNFFLISFLPAIAYWYLEANYSVTIAIAGGLILASLELIIEKIFIKHIHTISKFNFFLILFLGIIALIGNDGIWFKLQPCFTGVAIGIYMLYKNIKGDGLLWEMFTAMNNNLPPKEIIKSLETHLSIFFGIYGIFMAFVAIYLTTDYWLFFKTLGFYAVFFIFFILEIIIIRRRIKKKLMTLNNNNGKRF